MVANLEPVRRIRGRFGLRRIGWRFDEFGISESDSEPFAPLPSSAARRARTVSSQSPAPAGNRQPRNYPWILWNLRWNLHLNLTMIKDLNGIQAWCVINQISRLVMLSISIRFLLELVHRDSGIFFDAKSVTVGDSVLIISQRKMCIVCDVARKWNQNLKSQLNILFILWNGTMDMQHLISWNTSINIMQRTSQLIKSQHQQPNHHHNKVK